MVDIVSRRCREPSCGRRPLYNMDGLRPVCCSQHKSPGMIDVVSTRCQEPVSRLSTFSAAYNTPGALCWRARATSVPEFFPRQEIALNTARTSSQRRTRLLVVRHTAGFLSIYGRPKYVKILAGSKTHGTGQKKQQRNVRCEEA